MKRLIKNLKTHQNLIEIVNGWTALFCRALATQSALLYSFQSLINTHYQTLTAEAAMLGNNPSIWSYLGLSILSKDTSICGIQLLIFQLVDDPHYLMSHRLPTQKKELLCCPGQTLQDLSCSH